MATEMSNLNFEYVVSKLCQSWDVLRHSVDANFGGIHSKEKAEWLENVIVEFFNENADLESSEVESFISEIMDNEFSLIIEDNSLINLSRNLCQCYSWLKNSDLSRLTEFLSKLKSPVLAPIHIVTNKDDELSSSDGDEAEEPMQLDSRPVQTVNQEKILNENKISQDKIEIDDGWTVVSHKKKQ